MGPDQILKTPGMTKIFQKSGTSKVSPEQRTRVQKHKMSNAYIVLFFFGLGVPPKWLSIILLQAFSFNVVDILCFHFVKLLLALFSTFFVFGLLFGFSGGSMQSYFPPHHSPI
jgi:hypothetical protein